jgi:hypothetical protein
MSSINSNPFGVFSGHATAQAPTSMAAQNCGPMVQPHPAGGPAIAWGYFEEKQDPRPYPSPHTFQIFNNRGQLVVMVDHFGGVIFGAGAASWDTAAKAFWEAMVLNNPLAFECNVLKEHRRELVQSILQLNKHLAELSDENAKLREKLRNEQT